MTNKDKILQLIRQKGKITSSEIIGVIGVSRQYVNMVISDLIAEKEVVKLGGTRNAFYVSSDYILKHSDIVPNVFRKAYKNKSLEEHKILLEIEERFPKLAQLPENVKSIFTFAFSEMFNNAIEHSQSRSISIEVAVRDRDLSFIVNDSGVGVFRNIMKKRNLKSEVQAIQDLLKGKTTTMPKSHSGEGIFFTSKSGDVFILGGNVYEFLFSRGMVAQVRASPQRPPTVPSWFSQMLPLSFDLAMEIGRFRRLMQERIATKEPKADVIKFIHDYLYVDENAAESIYIYFKEQFDYCKKIPTDKQILVEYFNDGEDKKIIFHTLFGRRVNDCLSRAVAFAIAKTQHKDVEVGMNDNGFYIAGDKKIHALGALKFLKSAKLELLLSAAIESSEVFKRRFRHCATRALMILRNYMGRQKRVGRQQVSSMILMSALRRLDPNFSILKEARREVLEDLMDIENTKKVIKLIEKGDIRLVEMDTKIPSPFAFKIALQGHVDVMKIEDKHEFLRKMHQMVLAKIGKTNPEVVLAKTN